MVYCKGCGNENPDNAKFCQECGNELNPQTEDQIRLKKEKSTRLIVIGYIFAFLGIFPFLGIFIFVIFPMISLILGLILLRRGGPDRSPGIKITVISALILLASIVVLGALVFFPFIYLIYG